MPHLRPTYATPFRRSRRTQADDPRTPRHAARADARTRECSASPASTAASCLRPARRADQSRANWPCSPSYFKRVRRWRPPPNPRRSKRRRRVAPGRTAGVCCRASCAARAASTNSTRPSAAARAAAICDSPSPRRRASNSTMSRPRSSSSSTSALLMRARSAKGNSPRRKPPQPIDKGFPGPGLLAQVVVSKYQDHCVQGEAVYEMRVGLSWSGCRTRPQTAGVLLWSRAMVVSDSGKGAA